MKKPINMIAALGLALALPAALFWYYDVYVHWQPKLYPFAVASVVLGCVALTLLMLQARGERKPKALAWKTMLSLVFCPLLSLIGLSFLINNVLNTGGWAKLAASYAFPLTAAYLLLQFVLLLKKLRKPVVAVCLAVSCLLSATFMIGAPYYMDHLYKAPAPVLPEGQFAPMPELGEVDFTVPADGSIEQVRDLIREARANGESKHFTVLIEDGEYPISQIVFDERDHDTTYRSRDGGVTLNGGMRLNPQDFTAWDKDENIQVIGLTKLGLGPDDWGELYPYGAHTMAAQYDNGIGPLPCELYCNGRRMTTARYPNGDEWLKTGEVLDEGDRSGERNPRGGTFTLDEKTAKRAAGWADTRDIWVYGFFKWDWAETPTRVTIDREAGTLTTEHGSLGGFEKGKPYYFYNVLEELDEPGEWYLDRNAGLLYLWPFEDDFTSARMDLTINTEHLLIGDNLKNLSFIGLTLQGTRGDAMVLRGDDLTVSHCVVQNIAGSALTMDGYNNTACDNTVRHVGSKGISISGGDYVTLTPGNSRAVNNLVHDWAEVIRTYQGGVNVYGVGNTAAHNEIFNAPHTAMFFGGRNFGAINRFVDGELVESPHFTVLLGGNDNVIEHNLIHDVCLLTDDAGAIYSGRSLWDSQGTVIRNNLIYNLGSNGHTPDGIYLDDGLSGVTVENNLLVNVPGLALHFSGRDLEAHGNIVVNAGRPVSYDERMRGGALDGNHWFHGHSREGGPLWTELWASPWQTDIWKTAYPKLAAYTSDFSDTDNPGFAANCAGSSVTGNVFIGPNKPNIADSVLRFSEIGPNREHSMLRKYWTLPAYEMIQVDRAGRAGAAYGELDRYNVQWDSQSENSDGSMPVGGGGVGLNVWAEDGSLYFYIGKNDSFDENGALYKLGRVKLTMEPNPFDSGAAFRQELRLRDGYIRIEGTGSDGNTAGVNIWVDVFHPAIHVEADSARPVSVTTEYQSWRTADQVQELTGENPLHHQYLDLYGHTITEHADTVGYDGGGVLFYHKNDGSDLLIDKMTAQQELTDLEFSDWYDPQTGFTFGGFMAGDGMEPAGEATGRYRGREYRAWALRSGAPATRQRVDIYLATGQYDDVPAWRAALDDAIAAANDSGHQDTKIWWNSFWDRSNIVINPGKGDSDEAWQLARNYALFRYMEGCYFSGDYPAKFNGGMFTWDDEGNPDFRRWGGMTMVGQNQRHIYWPLLKSGDYDLITPQFDFYNNALGNNKRITGAYWGHGGAAYAEYLPPFGMTSGYCYGDPSAAPGADLYRGDLARGTILNSYVNFEYVHQLDFAKMILEYHAYSGADISGYLDFIESSVLFHREHYRYWYKKYNPASTDGYDAHGKLVIYPSTAAETYKNVLNPTDVVYALQAVLEDLVGLQTEGGAYTAINAAAWADMLGRLPVPNITGGVFKPGYDPGGMAAALRAYDPPKDGVNTYNTENYSGRQNVEAMQLSVVYPFNLVSQGRPLAKEAVKTWNRELGGDQKNTVSWHYGNIIAARLGLVKEAKAMNTAKLRNAGRRFPAFWGPGHDWTPDHNWGGTGMAGLQEMALQAYGDTIQPFACWPSDWDGSFKLHAPKRTLVEAKTEGRRVKFVKITVEEGSGRDSVELLLPGASRCSVYDENGEPVPAATGSDRITFGVSAGKAYYVFGGPGLFQ